jgi:hypothetical protein
MLRRSGAAGALGAVRHRPGVAVNENFSLVVMIIFIFLSLAFLADQILTYR